MRHLMIDIETLDTARTAVVLSCAWIVFDPRTGVEHAQGFKTLPIQSQLDYGRTISESTLRFWLDQKPEILAEQMRAASELAVVDLHDELGYQCEKADAVWANSPTFDIVILEDLFSCFGHGNPFPFRRLMDIRTIRHYLPEDWAAEKRHLTTHRPIDDCRSQIEDVVGFHRRATTWQKY